MKRITKISLLGLCFYFCSGFLYGQDAGKSLLTPDSKMATPLEMRSVQQKEQTKLKSYDPNLVRVNGKVVKRLPVNTVHQAPLLPVEIKNVKATQPLIKQ